MHRKHTARRLYHCGLRSKGQRQGNLLNSATPTTRNAVSINNRACCTRESLLTVFISAELVRWVSESKRPFSIVKDRGFIKLMKTGRPSYWLPSPVTVSRDVKSVFARVRQRIANMLNVGVSSLISTVVKSLTIRCVRRIGPPGQAQLRHGRLDFTEPPGLHRDHGPLGARRQTALIPA